MLMDIKTDRIIGSVLGLALGDAFGAPYEGGILERAVWAVLGNKNGRRRWTDDTQMTINVIESLVARGGVDPDDLGRRFAQSYKWTRGYGPGAAKVLKRIRRGQHWEAASRAVFREGSFGNGGAMRAPAVGLFYAAGNEDDLAKAASASARVTHAHPLGREGAVVIALATALAYNDAPSLEIIDRIRPYVGATDFSRKLSRAKSWLRKERRASPRTVRAELGNGIAAADSCVTAVYIALSFRDDSFGELLDFAIDLRGDVDTIAAMSCAIWGAARGREALPRERLERLERCDRLHALARSLAEAAGARGDENNP